MKANVDSSLSFLIYSHPQTLSLYHNSSLRLDMRDASSRDRNLCQSDILPQTIVPLCVSEGIFYVSLSLSLYIYIYPWVLMIFPEISELVGCFLLYKLNDIIDPGCHGLYRDEGLIMIIAYLEKEILLGRN